MSKARLMKFVVIILVVGATYAWQRYGGALSDPANGPTATPTASSNPPPAERIPAAEPAAARTASPPSAAPQTDARKPAPPETARRKVTTPKRNDDAVIAEAFRRQQSDVMVESEGRVSRVLPDDNEGSRHQRFIVRLANGRTVLIAHNIDLAPRVPLSEGDTVRFHGEYEWNDRGGVVHWTHHDPRGRHEGGWLELAGRRYE